LQFGHNLQAKLTILNIGEPRLALKKSLI
jgi:hypothetical protein